MSARRHGEKSIDYVVRSHEMIVEPVARPLHGAAGGVLTRLREALQTALAALRRRQAERETLRQIAGLNDHLLADIGINRDHVLEQVREAGRAPVVSFVPVDRDVEEPTIRGDSERDAA